MKKGSKVYLKDPFWHKNTNLGGKEATILSTTSYILVKVYDYHSNPVKCFRHEISDKPTKTRKPPSKDAKPPAITEEGYKDLLNYISDKEETENTWNSWLI
jgi:hypothetical protein